MKYQICNICEKSTSDGFYTLIRHDGDSSLCNNEEYKHYHGKCVNPTQQKSKTGRFDNGIYWACDFSSEYNN